MKIIKDILKYVLLWLGTAVLALGLDVFLNIDTDLMRGILTLIFTAIIAIKNKHNILQVVMDLVISFIILIVLVWALILDVGTSILSGPIYLVVIFSIATIASISKHR